MNDGFGYRFNYGGCWCDRFFFRNPVFNSFWWFLPFFRKGFGGNFFCFSGFRLFFLFPTYFFSNNWNGYGHSCCFCFRLHFQNWTNIFFLFFLFFEWFFFLGNLFDFFCCHCHYWKRFTRNFT